MAVSREPEFRTTRMREGYDLDAVDDFVDLVIDALEGRAAGRSVTPEQIEAEEFKVVRMREGYVMDDVDDWLDAAAAELRRMRKAAQASQQVSAQAYNPQTATMGGAPVGAPPVSAPPVGPPPVGPPSVGPPPVSQPPASPPVAPPVLPPPAAAGYAAPPSSPAGPPTQSNPTYPSYYETSHGTSHGTAHGSTASYDTQAYDPLTDSAVNELDPVLRALDPSFGTSKEQYAQTPARAPEPAVDDSSIAPSSTPSTGLHHIEIWVRDLDSATRSFGWLFERLGWTLFQAWENGRSWQAPGGGPYVVLECSPDLSWVAYDRKAPGLNHLALAVPEQWMVDRIVSEAPAYGWRLMFADRHPHAGGPHHYAAYMENEDGYEVEVVAP
ncbi:DivIVA domain-containing protein [Jiangella asiatica]|uniref:DivIVA domain-containing protein n=1 Tax=Jiangella asiatica TaxID=2530372 RepID=A0A4R5DPK7_9ACTN|nr:DivIVA domain-containing protein [Jiangella asiatica]TDE14100.1 DivIVA domain-containing protein [Jiangella asiatica]